MSFCGSDFSESVLKSCKAPYCCRPFVLYLEKKNEFTHAAFYYSYYFLLQEFSFQLVIYKTIYVSTHIEFQKKKKTHSEIKKLLLLECFYFQRPWSRFWLNLIFLFLLFTLLRKSIFNDQQKFEYQS